MLDRLQHKPGVDREIERQRKWAAIKRELELSEMGWALFIEELKNWPVTRPVPTMVDDTQYDHDVEQREGWSVP